MVDSNGFEVRDKPEASRYEVVVDGETAVLEYERRDGRIVLVHTGVPETLAGRGIASALARHALDTARAEGTPVIVRCPYVRAWLRKNPGYRDVVA